MDLNQKVNEVVSHTKLAEFIVELREDLFTNAEEWENRTLDSFLDALSAWVLDMDGYYINQGVVVPSSPDWKNVAEMLLAAKSYE